RKPAEAPASECAGRYCRLRQEGRFSQLHLESDHSTSHPESPIWTPRARSHRTERDGELPASSFLLPDGSTKAPSRGYRAAIDAALRSSLTRDVPFRDTPAGSTSLFMLSLRVRPRSRGVPREARDAPEDLPEQARRQVALGKLEDE